MRKLLGGGGGGALSGGAADEAPLARHVDVCAIDVRRHILCWMGGWAPGSATLEHHYLDPSVTPSPAAYAFYGWLLRGEYEMGMPAWVDAARARVVDDIGEYF